MSQKGCEESFRSDVSSTSVYAFEVGIIIAPKATSVR